MRRTIRATLAAAGVAVAGLLLLAVCFGGLAAVFHHNPDITAWEGQQRIELMPPDSNEYAERHYPGPDGKDLKTVIQYRNGDHGVKLYRADNTLKEWTVEFAAGDVRLHIVFADDGKQVVLGEQLRPDRTMLWKATSKDSVVTLTQFYYDGTTPFSVVRRKVGVDTQDTQYYRKDGTPWLRQVGDRNKTDNPDLQQVWDSAGKLVYERQTIDKDGKTTTVTYYRPDGTAAYKQTWVEHQSSNGYGEGYGYEGYGYSYPSTTTSLRTVEEFGADGTSITRRIQQNDDGTNVDSVTVYAGDGSSVTYTMNSTHEVTHVEKKNKDGAVTSATDPKPGVEKAPEISNDLTKALPTPPNPTAYWKVQETDKSKRGDPAP